ncbi:hypothetical protein APHCRT_0218 [Anaplasma phagocytophilum str. CRT53-1]|uniref:Uncharacterized protein n=1 Tax=Anaplasma phagocytophilum str. CRT53-1 TaxID=1359157 RepID=A0A0F3PIP6_ANAPH|nr:hypothetical protein APHCRT_1653 [Anaplasma phagocytophilum str. CRT53-1]KJV88082.1 hypothetical protein APHCRT_0218 [Anaplasma phagocytophilum str. CRT53-1]
MALKLLWRFYRCSHIFNVVEDFPIALMCSNIRLCIFRH